MKALIRIGFGLFASTLLASAQGSPAWGLSKFPLASKVIGLVQYDADSRWGDRDFHREQLTRLAEQAIGRGARLVLLPEGALTGYASRRELWCRPGQSRCGGRACRDVSQIAEVIPRGPSSRYWEEFARAHGIYLVFDLAETDVGTGEFFNTLAVFGPRGYVTKYRKRDLYWVDQCYAEPGREAVAFNTPFGRFGLMACMDGVDYPGTFYSDYRRLGVDAVLLSMDWDEDPLGPNAARTAFVDRARTERMPIYASDESAWDGTGLYLPDGSPRERDGLAPQAVGSNGISMHSAPR